MRKLVHLGLLAAIGLLATGCAVTNYGVITDTWERQSPTSSVGIVNTDGEALLGPYIQVITSIDFFDPRYEDVDVELTTYAEQDADGNQVLRTKGNVTSYFGLQFNDHVYCTPDASRCAVAVADNPVVGDVDIFDYTFGNCFPANVALQLLGSLGGRTFECGRGMRLFPWLNGTGLSDADLLELVEMATPIHGADGEDFIRLDLNKDTLGAFRLEANGHVYPVAIPDEGSFTVLFDPGNPTLKFFLDRKGWPVFEAYLDAVDALRAAEPTGSVVTFQVELLGKQFTSPSWVQLAFAGSMDTAELRTLIGGEASVGAPVRTRADRRAR